MKTNYLSIAALATLVLAGCSSDEDFVTQDNLKDTPITIQSAGVAELMTRATTTPLEGTAEKPVSIGVFVTDGSANEYNATNMKWTHSGTAWEATSTTLYEGANSAQQIYAYYPYVADMTGTIAVTAAYQIDYLVATPTALESSTVSLTMSHALAKLVLEATTGTEIATGETIATVEVQNMYESGTWNVSTNQWSNLADIPSATLEMKNNEVLVIPNSNCSYFPIVITTNLGRVFKTDISLFTVGNKLDAGTQYTIKLQVGQDKVELGSISAAPWENDTVDEPLETL